MVLVQAFRPEACDSDVLAGTPHMDEPFAGIEVIAVFLRNDPDNPIITGFIDEAMSNNPDWKIMVEVI
jgi:hypothetical protein